MKILECYKKVNEDWLGNYEGNYVKVLLRPLNSNGILWRVGVWGNDDFGMICDLETYEEALSCFEDILQIDVLSVETLFNLEHGFEVF